MQAGDIVWTWAGATSDRPVKPHKAHVARSGEGTLGVYDAEGGLLLWAEYSEGWTAATEAEAIEGWRAAVVAHVKARRLDDQHLIQEAFDGHPGALGWAESVADTITRLERKCDSLTALLAQAEADNRAWAERCRWIPVGEKMPPEGAPVRVFNRDGDQCIATLMPDLGRSAFFGHGHPPGHVTHWRPLDPGPDAT